MDCDPDVADTVSLTSRTGSPTPSDCERMRTADEDFETDVMHLATPIVRRRVRLYRGGLVRSDTTVWQCNRCHALLSGGDIVRHHWYAHYELEHAGSHARVTVERLVPQFPWLHDGPALNPAGGVRAKARRRGKCT